MENEAIYQENRRELIERRLREQPVEVSFILGSLIENGPEKTDETIDEAIKLYETQIRGLTSDENVLRVLKIIIDRDPKDLEAYIKQAKDQYADMIKNGLINVGPIYIQYCTSCLGGGAGYPRVSKKPLK